MSIILNINLTWLQGKEDAEAAAADDTAAKAMQQDGTHASETASSKEPVQLVLRIGRGLTPEPVSDSILQSQAVLDSICGNFYPGHCQALGDQLLMLSISLPDYALKTALQRDHCGFKSAEAKATDAQTRAHLPALIRGSEMHLSGTEQGRMRTAPAGCCSRHA